MPLLPLFIFIAVHAFRHFQLKYLYALVIPVLLVAIHFYFDGNKSEFTSHHFLEEWSVGNYFKRSFASTEAINLASLSYPYPNVIYYLGLFFYPGFFFLNGVLFVLSFRKRKELLTKPNWVLGSMVLVNFLFLSGVTFQGDRYLFPSYPFFVILLYPAFKELLNKLQSKKGKKILWGV